MSRWINKYSMELYTLHRENFESQLHKVPENIKFISVTKKLLEKNKSYCADHYSLWKHNYKKGAKGLFVVCDGKIVGHGWLKINGVKDSFYRFGENIAYISELYVDSDFRGRSIAPAMISHFIRNTSEHYNFFISVYVSNVASRNALLKVGFSYVRSFDFVRALKITWNKHTIL